MELVDGRSLRDVLKIGRGPARPARHRDRRRGGSCAVGRPPGRARPPRRQAGQHPPCQGRHGEGDRLRYRPGLGRQPGADQDRRSDRDRHLFQPGAGSGCRLPMPGAMSMPLAWCSTRCSPGARRTPATARCRLPSNTSRPRRRPSEFAQCRRPAVARHGGGQGDAKGPGRPVPERRRDARRPGVGAQGRRGGAGRGRRCAVASTAPRRRRNAGDDGHPGTSGHGPPR